MATQRHSFPTLASSQSIAARPMRARAPQAVAAPRPRRGRPNEPRLYNWDELATAERQAVMALVQSSRRQRKRARRRALAITVLLVLLIAAGLTIVVFGIGSPLTLSL